MQTQEPFLTTWTRRTRNLVRRSTRLLSDVAHLRVVARDASRLLPACQPFMDHAAASMGWLRRAQDQCDGGGVAATYSLIEGWSGPYPETTGYIIETFLDWAQRTGTATDVERAIRMGDWEIEVQLPSGAVRGLTGIHPHPIVFNTGQVIFGWVALARVTGQERFAQAARRAGDWLVEVMDEDGKWSRFVYQDCPTVYHTRVAWSLHELTALTGDDRYATAANRNLRWALAQRLASGHFGAMAFRPEDAPHTHTIAYTLRGFQESARFVPEPLASALRDVVTEGCNRVLRAYELRKVSPEQMPRFLPSTLDSKWKSRDTSSCLTGNVQLAAILLREYRLHGDIRLLNGALKLIEQTARTQPMDLQDVNVYGGIAGSYPIWGRYMRLQYPNWAAKFFVDAVLLLQDVLKDEQASAQGAT